MKSIRGELDTPFRTVVRPEFLGCEVPTKGYIFAIESYIGSCPTLSFRSDSGHCFFFLPPHAFGLKPTLFHQCADQPCVAGPIDVTTFAALSSSGWGTV